MRCGGRACEATALLDTNQTRLEEQRSGSSLHGAGPIIKQLKNGWRGGRVVHVCHSLPPQLTRHGVHYASSPLSLLTTSHDAAAIATDVVPLRFNLHATTIIYPRAPAAAGPGHYVIDRPASTGPAFTLLGRHAIGPEIDEEAPGPGEYHADEAFATGERPQLDRRLALFSVRAVLAVPCCWQGWPTCLKWQLGARRRVPRASLKTCAATRSRSPSLFNTSSYNSFCCRPTPVRCAATAAPYPRATCRRT